MNVYDVRLDDESPACGMNWPPDLKDITPYLRVRFVRLYLHLSFLDRYYGREAMLKMLSTLLPKQKLGSNALAKWAVNSIIATPHPLSH